MSQEASTAWSSEEAPSDPWSPLRAGWGSMPVLISVLLLVILFAFTPNFRWSDLRESPYAGDFLQEWVGGHIVLKGDRSRLYDRPYAKAIEHDPTIVRFAWDESQYLPIVYPPFYYSLVSPLSLMPVRVAAWVWAGLMVLSLGGFVALIAHCMDKHSPSSSLSSSDLDRESEKRFTFLWALPGVILFAPVLESLSSSQKGPVCLLLLTATYLLLRRDRALMAGVVFGLLAFKPQLTLVLIGVMLAKREWRFLLGSSFTGACLLGWSLMVGGKACLDYVTFATTAGDYWQSAGYDLHKSHSLFGFFELISSMTGRAGGVPMRAAQGTAIAIVVVLLIRLLQGPLRTTSSRFPLQFAGISIATVLLSPHLFTYDLTLLLLPIVLIGTWCWKRREERSPAVQGSMAMVALLYVLPGVSPSLALLSGIQITVPVMLALLYALRVADGSFDRDDSRIIH